MPLWYAEPRIGEWTGEPVPVELRCVSDDGQLVLKNVDEIKLVIPDGHCGYLSVDWFDDDGNLMVTTEVGHYASGSAFDWTIPRTP